MPDLHDRFHRSLLVLRCQVGDEAAFAELVAFYQPRLRYFVGKLLRDRHSIDDLLQEVWLDVYRGLARLVDPGAFAAWLYQLARRRAWRWLQQRPLPSSLDELDPPAPSCEPAFLPDDAAQVHAALDRLNPEQREILLLRFMEGFSYEEIARVTATPLGTVRSRLHYARRALRRLIERTACYE